MLSNVILKVLKSVGDSLFVSHSFNDIKPGHTLRNLCLELLENRIKENNGSVYRNQEEVILFVDIKDDVLKTYKLLHKILSDYKPNLTIFQNSKKVKEHIDCY